MQTLALLVAPVLGFYHRFFRLSLRFILLMFMDFPSTFNFITQASELACGFLLLGYFSRIFNLLGLLLIFLFCLRFLRSSPKKLKQENFKDENSRDENNNNHNNSSNNNNNCKEEHSIEDEVFDVMSLRRMVKAERQRYNAACAEIEKEQGAAASAAEEAMAMILRLQSEKSAVEIQAKQFRRVVEQKQEYDLEVMESLRWTVEQIESQKNIVERQLRVLKERLKQFLNDQEIQRQLQAEQEEEIEEEEIVKEEMEEEEHGTGTGTASVCSDDADSSGFLNFSIEYDVDVAAVAASSSQNQSPTHNHTQQQQHL